MSEGQTWSSEDTRLLVSKSFLAPARNSICLPSLRSALTAAAFSEAERIVFAAEGLFLAHDFPVYCGIRAQSTERHPMIFTETKLKGSYLIELEKHADQRGFFARAWCEKEFDAYGLNAGLAQVSISYNAGRGTLRGMHYQAFPYEETKLVRCTAGAIYDVILDLRPDSATYRQWLGVELTADNYRSLYIPEGFAHGFLTLEDSTEVLYHVSQFYQQEAERGVRYNDPAFGIKWPTDVLVLSDKDKGWPDYRVTETLKTFTRGTNDHYR